jgi:hypothetical protein
MKERKRKKKKKKNLHYTPCQPKMMLCHGKGLCSIHWIPGYPTVIADSSQVRI